MISTVPGASPIRLRFSEGISVQIRSRIEYAFRVYAAVYGYHVSDPNSNQNARTVLYGVEVGNSVNQSSLLRVPALYQPAAKNRRIEGVTRHIYAGEEFFLINGLDPQTGRPDWLGEIFQWLSSEHEKSILVRDGVGRIPDHEMIFARYGIPAWKPHVSCLMAWLDNCLHGEESRPALPRAPSPVPEVDHLVLCSHDVDFYYTNRLSAFRRLIKNLGIGLFLFKSSDYFLANATMLTRLLLAGKSVGDYLPETMRRLRDCGATSTFFVVTQRAHRRDPNYSLEDLAPILGSAAQTGFPVEIHASYTSSIEADSLESEAAALSSVLQKRPTGTRQHWLRFSDLDDLFRQVAEAGLRFDSSLGFTHHIGFRNGASFAFPPYNFKEERPYDFLEIPLAIMDGSLAEECQTTRQDPQFLADRMLAESRKYGWGGISVLWHNPVEALPVPNAINRVFWNCLANKESYRERWISTDDFFSLCLRRYHDAGLLGKVHDSKLGADLPGRDCGEGKPSFQTPVVSQRVLVEGACDSQVSPTGNSK